MANLILKGNTSGQVTIQAPDEAGTTTLTLPTTDSTLATQNSLGVRNLIINGDMRIDQRNAGSAVTANGNFPVDRFQIFNSTDGAFSAQQDSSAPTGFVNSLKFTTTTADGTLTTTQATQFQQRIEGFNFANLGWGTASAKTVTISFWVRSSLTGTFGGSLRNNAQDRSYPFTYVISVADTWEYKTVTVAGDTSGTWLTNNSVGCRLTFGLGGGPDVSGTASAWAGANYSNTTGAVSVIGTLNATWYITGVQLEVGDTATPFEHRPYDMELARCMRYFQIVPIAGTAHNSSELCVTGTFRVDMRDTPSINSTVSNRPGYYNGSLNTLFNVGYGNAGVGNAYFAAGVVDKQGFGQMYVTSGLTGGRLYAGGAIMSAEL